MGETKEVLDDKCSLPRTAKLSKPGCNFTWDGQAGLGRQPWEGGGGRPQRGGGEGVFRGFQTP